MQIERRYCQHCKKEVDGVVEVLPENQPHYAKINCSICSRYIAFMSNPDKEDKKESSKYKPKDFGIDYCRMCLRHKNGLGVREVLEIHHVIPVADNGPDEPENIWVICTACHKYIHHQRTYLNNHLKGRYSFSQLEKDLKKNGVPVRVQEQLKRIYKMQEAANAGYRN